MLGSLRKVFGLKHLAIQHISIYIKRCVSQSVSLSPFVCPWGTNNLFVPGDKQFVCPPGDKHFSHTGGGGQTNCLSPGDKHFLHTEGGTNIFLMMMITVGNVSGANILSSEARKPPAGARISGPVGPWNSSSFKIRHLGYNHP